jgi:hypothetical protein
MKRFALLALLVAACAAPAQALAPAASVAPTASPTPVPSASQAPIRLVTLGDSITAPTNPCGAGWPTLLPPGMLVHDAGVGGNDTTQMLARLQSDVLAYHPTDVAVMAGTNDVNRGIPRTITLANLGSIIGQTQASGATVWLLTIPPYEAPWGKSSDAAVAAYNADLRTLTVASGARLIDSWNKLAMPDGAWSVALTCDLIHPSGPGAYLVALTVEAALL